MIASSDGSRENLQQRWLLLEKHPNGGRGSAPTSSELPWLEPGVTPLPSRPPRSSEGQHKASPVPEPPASSQHSGYVAVGCAVAGNRLPAFSLPLSLRPKTTLLLTEGTSPKIFDKGASIRKLQPLLLEEV